MSGSFISPEFRARVRRLGEPVALAFGRLGLTPNALTLIGFLITCLGAGLAAAQLWLPAAAVVLFGGIFDLFDGALARATGRVSAVGGFLDSVFDRAGESVVYLGVLWGALGLGVTAPVFLAASSLAAAFLVSYTRARAESLGLETGTGMAAVGFAPREIRIVILAVGLAAAGLLRTDPPTGGAGGAAYPLDGLALTLSLGILTLLATVTAIQRTVHTVRAGSRSTGNGR